MVSVDHFGQELRSQMTRAASNGATDILINGGELCRTLRGDRASMEACSNAMRAELKPGDIVFIEAGAGVGMTVQYQLPRGGQ
jgi:Rad3-related DNA helicase